MLVIMNLNDILQRSYKMTKTKKITEKDIVDKEENITFVFSTHDQRVVDRARGVITLVDGKIASDERR